MIFFCLKSPIDTGYKKLYTLQVKRITNSYYPRSIYEKACDYHDGRCQARRGFSDHRVIGVE